MTVHTIFRSVELRRSRWPQLTTFGSCRALLRMFGARVELGGAEVFGACRGSPSGAPLVTRDGPLVAIPSSRSDSNRAAAAGSPRKRFVRGVWFWFVIKETVPYQAGDCGIPASQLEVAVEGLL